MGTLYRFISLLGSGVYMDYKLSSNHDIAVGEVKPDVLEMIALLHHHELMPASIYAYVPAENLSRRYTDALLRPAESSLHMKDISTSTYVDSNDR